MTRERPDFLLKYDTYKANRAAWFAAVEAGAEMNSPNPYLAETFEAYLIERLIKQEAELNR